MNMITVLVNGRSCLRAARMLTWQVLSRGREAEEAKLKLDMRCPLDQEVRLPRMPDVKSRLASAAYREGVRRLVAPGEHVILKWPVT